MDRAWFIDVAYYCSRLLSPSENVWTGSVYEHGYFLST